MTKHKDAKICASSKSKCLYAAGRKGLCGGTGAESLLREAGHKRQHSRLRNGTGCPPRSSHRLPPQLQHAHKKVNIQTQALDMYHPREQHNM